MTICGSEASVIQQFFTRIHTDTHSAPHLSQRTSVTAATNTLSTLAGQTERAQQQQLQSSVSPDHFSHSDALQSEAF